MYRINSYLTIIHLLLFFILSCNGEKESSQQQGRIIQPDHKVTIYDGDEVVTEVNVALAQTSAERSLGLMEVYFMPFDTGMLFLFGDEMHRSFWMENTPIPLDIIFINSNREIVHIRAYTTPYSRDRISSEYPAQFVLEVNAGFSREFDIREGMRIGWEPH